MDEWEQLALEYLPQGVRTAVLHTVSSWNRPINEIRLRQNKPLYLTLGRINAASSYICTDEDIAKTASDLCQGSLYSYAENIKEGVIATGHGIRAGVCGRAVIRNGVIDCVRDISSINIRIPHRINGASDALYELVNECGSVLVYSKPGRGKTTLLRELIPLLTAGKDARRVSVIDTRLELSAGITECETADFLLGYPRRDGMMSAVRTMSPEYIICDEISDSHDAEAVMFAHSAGVNVVVSAHAGSYAELMANKNISELIKSCVFGALYGIKDDGYEVQRINE